ncbi:MAG: chromosomal replication initiator protein DnaA [Anaerolineaceae bacterium]|nr:chromosomal replication initiator protein DnaA [Chloroflexi bacterium CFX2]GJQ37261.1 MAG: chromosomal replication initiator protein DnaA [Anaerolineaceae bacterium]
MNAEQAWQTVLAQLQMDMPRASFDTWVRDTRPVGYDNGMLTVGVRNAYARDWLDTRLAATVNKLLIDTLNSKVSVKFIVSQSEDAVPSMDPDPAPASIQITPPEPKPRHVTLNPRYTFDTYVVGSGNRLAHAACQAVADKPARAYNPLFLYGGVGLGKTHLLHAIGNACHASGLNVLYVSSEEFTNDLIAAIRTHTTQAFREKYRSADVLLIDDIQFIAGKESTQEEFFHTFNTLHGQDKQIIVSSDRPPKSLITLEERLRSRFEWGLTADIQAPDLETRLAILRSKAERTGRRISDEILESIAKRVQSNIRELEGALNRIIAYADLSGVSLTPDLVDVALADLLPTTRNIPPGKILEAFAAEAEIDVKELIGQNRSAKIVEPRQLAMYILSKLEISSPQIGELLGGRDHSTVLHGIKKVAENEKLRRRADNILHNLINQSIASV